MFPSVPSIEFTFRQSLNSEQITITGNWDADLPPCISVCQYLGCAVLLYSACSAYCSTDDVNTCRGCVKSSLCHQIKHLFSLHARCFKYGLIKSLDSVILPVWGKIVCSECIVVC